MSRTWAFAAAALVSVAVVGVLTFLTPDTPVPVVESDGFTYSEAERTLDEVGPLLEADPTVDVEGLRADYPLLAGTEGREPAGVIWAAIGTVATLIGTLAWTRARNRYGCLLIAFGATAALGGVARAVSDLTVHDGDPSAGAGQVAFALADTLWIPLGVTLGPLLLASFPDGRLLSRRWRSVVAIAAVASVLLLAAQLAHPYRYDGRALAPDPGLNLDVVDALFLAGDLLWRLALVAASISLVVRFRRSVGPERDQLKWVVLGLTVSVVLLALSDVAQSLGGDRTFWGPVGAVGFLGLVPLTFLFSIFRYRLFSIDVVINRTIAFGLLSALVAAIYVGAIAAAGSLVGAGGLPSALIAMAVTAAVFEPLHARVVSLVDGYVWRRGADPREALSEVVATMSRGDDTDAGLEAIVDGVARATNAAAVTLWERRDGAFEVGSVWPHGMQPLSIDSHEYVADSRQAAILGVRTAPGDRLRRAERRLVDDMARLSATFIENVRLRRDLDVIVAELEARQNELVAAEERLRTVVDRTTAAVERDLHDGAQARAVVLATAIGLARESASSVDAGILASEIDAAEAAVTSFANGLYPHALRNLGFPEAVRDQARATLPTATVEVHAGGVPDDVAAVAYLVATEAMVNVAKHAAGCTSKLSCRMDEDGLHLSVLDDGPGFSPSARSTGSGLSSITERVEALGGSLRIETRPTGGTSLQATIPLGP